MDRSVPSAIFTVDDDRVRSILHDYGIQDSMDTITELFRYNFSGREVRLILKVTFKNRASMVIKLKNEKDLSREVVEQQSGVFPPSWSAMACRLPAPCKPMKNIHRSSPTEAAA